VPAEPPIPDRPSAPAGRARSSLLVMSPVGVFTFLLPESGDVTIGRAADCEVRLDDPEASRYHARLSMGASPCVADQGSANGTFMAGRRLEPNAAVHVAAGELITVGSTVLALQGIAAHSPDEPTVRNRSSRLWSQDAFDTLVGRARGRQDGPGCAVVRVALVLGSIVGTSPAPRAQLMAEVARAEALESALREALRTNHVIASFGPGAYQVLLVETDASTARGAAAGLERSLREAGFDLKVDVEHYDWESGPSTDRGMAETLPPPSPDDDAVASARTLDGPTIERIASSDISVLILGETGVGKEVMARRLHRLSSRRDAPLVSLNCAAFSESLLESELFGFERGAFTGAIQSKTGLLESAQGGTAFLDEIGEMHLAVQAKLLRVLEQREVLRIGALKPRPIDVRFLSATNRDLEVEILAGRFRRDLYFRLHGISVHLRPLRERVHEIETLARSFLAEACARSGRAVSPEIAPAALALLKRYAWPGNVRELRNVMERAAVLCERNMIQLEHLPRETMAPVVELGRVPSGREVEALAALYGIDPERERAQILDALTECKGNQTQAAKRLGISRRTLVNRLGRHDLPRPRKGR
jgi:two-component system, NtrC family, response regulator AtoC